MGEKKKAFSMTASNWIAIIGIAITAAIAAFSLTTGLATQLFFSQSDGVALDTRIEEQYKAQTAVNKTIQSQMHTQQEMIQDININVVKIGERLRVSDLRREREIDRHE